MPNVTAQPGLLRHARDATGLQLRTALEHSTYAVDYSLLSLVAKASVGAGASPAHSLPGSTREHRVTSRSKDQNSNSEVWLLLSVYRFHARAQSKARQSNHRNLDRPHVSTLSRHPPGREVTPHAHHFDFTENFAETPCGRVFCVTSAPIFNIYPESFSCRSGVSSLSLQRPR